nr:putative wall-associated receptor kinase-like 16 [Ipomoea batatas]
MSFFLVLPLLVLSAVVGCLSKTISYPIAKPNCVDHCGNVSIPFPFGLRQGCYLNSDFFINCINSTDGSPKPFLGSGNVELETISIDGQLSVMQGIARRRHEGEKVSANSWMNLSAFYVNQTANKFVAVGCNTIATITGDDGEVSYETGCIASCNCFHDVVNGSCSGIGCCQTTGIPILASNVNFTLKTITKDRYNHGVVNCSYAFVVKKDEFNFSSVMLTQKWKTQKVPLVIDWMVSKDNCTNSSSVCKGNTTCEEYFGPDDGYRCACKKGYHGNPYLPPGCLGIDECANGQNTCSKNATCLNTAGSYSCRCKEGYNEDDKGGCQLPIKDECKDNGKGCHSSNRVNMMSLGAALGTIMLLVICFSLYLAYRQRKSLQMREKFFRDNGGMILQQRIAQEKSDVYSFGVVLVELLTSRKALSFDGPEKERQLSQYFLSLLKENQLFKIVDGNIVCEGNTEELQEVALLAKRCLNVKGEDRPTMKEVAVELSGLRRATKHPWTNNLETSIESEALLLTEQPIPFEYDATFSITTTEYDSLKHHMEFPVAAGR